MSVSVLPPASATVPSLPPASLTLFTVTLTRTGQSSVLSPHVSPDLVIVTQDCRDFLPVLGGHAFGQGEDRAKELTP